MDILKNIDHDNEKMKECDGKIPNIGFQTARGTSINISKEALSRAKALFADHHLEMDILENVDCNDEEIKKRNVKVSYDECQIANNQRIKILYKDPLKTRELFSNDCINKHIPDNAFISLQKHKLCSNENTPLGRSCASESKKARLSNEFPARRLSFDDLNVDTNNDGTDDEYIREIQAPCITELCNKNVVSKLCSDEKKQVDSITNFGLESPERDTERSTELDAISSPVIGRQPISRRRKNLGHRRDRFSLSVDKMINNENVPPQENIRSRSSPCKEKTNENKLNAEMQTERQNNNAESNEYSDTQIMIHFIDESAKILQNRLAAALEQEETITAKRRCGSNKQLTGCLYHHKQINSNARLSLRQIANGTSPRPYSHQELIEQRIPPNILAITAATAVSYKFRCSDFYGNDVARSNVRGIEMEDGVHLILDENGYVGVWEFLRAFLASPGVDPNLVPARWVENHYRWIIWKLASMDRMKFGTVELPRYNFDYGNINIPKSSKKMSLDVQASS
jgi:ribosomal protein S18